MRIRRNNWFRRSVAFVLAGALALTTMGVTKPTYAQLSVKNAYKIADDKTKWQKQSGGSFSSYEDGKNALKVDDAYGYQFIKTKNTEFTVTKGTKASRPSTVEEDASSADFYWFKTKSNTANNIQVKWSNLKIYQENQGWVQIDLVRTITKIEKHNGADTVTYTEDGKSKTMDCYVALGRKPTALAYIGVEEVSVRNDFYLAGTNTKTKIKTNITLTDIDKGQYIGVKSDHIDGQYVDKNTRLSYLNDDGTNIYWADEDGNAKATADSSVGFILYDNTFSYKFGKYRTYVANPTSVNHYVQYVGSGQLMVQIPPSDPRKTVSDNNETNVERNTVEHLGDTWTYEIEQPIPYGIPSQFYFGQFAFEDEIEPCMQIVDVRVQAEDEDGETKNVSDWFQITTDGNRVLATANADVLSAKKFYKYCVYRLRVNVKMNIPEKMSDKEYNALLEQWKAHGHYTETTDYHYIEETNTGKTAIDGTIRNTNKVYTNIKLPTKTVSDDDEAEVMHNDVRSLADSWVYAITQTIDQNLAEGTWYDSLVFTDDVEECLQIEKVAVVDAAGSDVTEKFSVTTTDHHVEVSLKNPKAAEVYQTASYTCKIQVRMYVPEDVTEEQRELLRQKWMEHGHYSEDKKYIRIGNIAKVMIDGVNVLTNEVVSDIHLSTNKEKDPEPGLAIEKSVTPYESQVGDVVTYTVQIWNTNEKADTAYFTIEDISLPTEMVINPDSIQVAGVDAENYRLEITDNGWVLNSVGDYKLPYGEYITVTYEAVSQKALNGTLVENTAQTRAVGIPEMSDTAQVYINSPKNDVVKTAPQEKYEVGDTVHYNVVITNRNPGTFMRDILLKDTVETDGLQIKRDSITVWVKGADVTAQTEIQMDAQDRGFTIITPFQLYKDALPVLTEQCVHQEPYTVMEHLTDEIVVTYDALITANAALENNLRNVFSAPATANTNGDVIRDDADIPSGGGSDAEAVPMKQPEIEITEKFRMQEKPTTPEEEATRKGSTPSTPRYVAPQTGGSVIPSSLIFAAAILTVMAGFVAVYWVLEEKRSKRTKKR